jgi:hypothetical protein
MEDGYRRAMMDQHNNLFGFMGQLVVHPVSLALTLGNVFTVLGQTQFWGRLKAKLSSRAEQVQGAL